jgi:hypothetical protein
MTFQTNVMEHSPFSEVSRFSTVHKTPSNFMQPEGLLLSSQEYDTTPNEPYTCNTQIKQYYNTWL